MLTNPNQPIKNKTWYNAIRVILEFHATKRVGNNQPFAITTFSVSPACA